MRYLLLLVLSFVLPFGGCYDPTGAPPVSSGRVEAANITLGDLAAMCPDRAIAIKQDLIISGSVVSSDEAGNFYHSLVLQDGTGGVEVVGGLSYLYRDYPPGSQVSVRLQGLAIGKRFGVVQVGRMPRVGDYAVEAIGSRALLDKHVQVAKKVVTYGDPSAVTGVGIAGLAPALCGTLVRVEELVWVEEDATEALVDRSWSGYRVFADREGLRVRVYTSVYARYATAAIPSGEVSITGILQTDGAGVSSEAEAGYVIKMRDERDCVP